VGGFNPVLTGLSKDLPRYVDLAPAYFDELWKVFDVVANVPARQIGSSSYSASGLQPDVTLGFTEFEPSVMSNEALFKAMTRYTLDGVMYPQELLDELADVIRTQFGPYFIGSYVQSFDSAISEMDLSKSPGWPLYYWYNSKLAAIESESKYIQHCISMLFEGEQIHHPSSVTLKDEILSAKKIADVRTRVFQNVALSTNLVGQMLFGVQDASLMENHLNQPSTIGVDVPGPGFLQIFCKVKDFIRKSPNQKQCFDADASSYDALYNLQVAGLIRDVRAEYLPPVYTKAVHAYYNEVYAGYASVLGNVLQLPSQKSGQILTGSDNGIGMFAKLYIPYKIQNPGSTVSSYFTDMIIKVNGDDVLGAKVSDSINFNPKVMVDILADYGVYLEIIDIELKLINECVFLSHKPVQRFFQQRQMHITVAGGRRDKLISGLRWRHKHNDAISLARFYALVNGLFPWAYEYYKCREVVDAWVFNHPRNKIQDVEWQVAKTTRLSEEQLFTIFTGLQ